VAVENQNNSDSKNPSAANSNGRRRRASNRVRIEDLADIHERCAGIDVHKAGVTVCLSLGGGEGEVAEFGVTTGELRQLRAWLEENGVTHVVMESTGVYWKPVWQILEQGSLQLLLANAKQVRNLPGRKTDGADAIWLATLLRKGLVRGSFIPPQQIRALRDLCRGRTTLVHDRTRITQRIEKVLEEANIKLDTVVSDLLGKSARHMLDELAAGQTDTVRMAELALGQMRRKIPELVAALEGNFLPHQLFLLRELLQQFDYLSSTIERYEQRIAEYAAPFEAELQRVDAMPGINRIAAVTILAETGVDMNQFPRPEQFCKWATICPGNHQSGGKRRNGSIGQGNRWLRGALTEAAWAASRTKDSYFKAQYARLLHRGKQRALVAVAHSMLYAIWHLLRHAVDYHDLGIDYFQRRNLQGQKKLHVRKLEKMGFRVTLEPAF